MADEQVAIVTGANRGMGLRPAASSRRLGFKVILRCRDLHAGETAADDAPNGRPGRRAFPTRFDRSPKRSPPWSYMLAGSFVSVDVLVNNAGIYLEVGRNQRSMIRISAFDARLEIVRAILETNLIGPFALSQGIIAIMRDTGHGRVVSITSAMGQLSDMGGGAPGYRMAAVGINGMTKFSPKSSEAPTCWSIRSTRAG